MKFSIPASLTYPYNCLYPALPILVTKVNSRLADTPVTRTAAKSQEKLNYIAVI